MDLLKIIKDKIIMPAELSKMVANWQLKNQKIVFTNGCFDLLHQGHVTYLAEAASYGNRMIVGLNSDASVTKLKGISRPIQDEYSRALIIASLHVVDAVVIFNDDTPENLIQTISPDYLIKGGDWKPEQIVGAKHVRSYGGNVCVIPFIDGFSTSAIVSKIQSQT
jgi:rfaE bifunctional protein nucleotidyltransferase chain/domain